MVKIGLDAKFVGFVGVALEARRTRDASFDQSMYTTSLNNLTKVIGETIALATSQPELGVRVAKECLRFILLAMPDQSQDPGRATSLSQCQTLEDLLAKVRNPKRYLAEMQSQFGPNLDPRHFPTAEDAFASIIKSQKNRIQQEGKGLNTKVEQLFCRKRGDLLTAVDKGYKQLRDRALNGENIESGDV